jgi:succinate dehydrogenase flavin-adding protein (antitoxin of CptAB toxin-antitoxin module)
MLGQGRSLSETVTITPTLDSQGAEGNAMIIYEDLHRENHNITELSNVLLYLFRDRAMCDTTTCCELFHRFTDKIYDHIDLVERNLYSGLLTHDDHTIQSVAKNFMSGSQEIKKLVAAYMKKWCPKQPGETMEIREYEHFLSESEEMFSLVLERIQDETEKLYPLVRELNGNMRKAS